MNKTKVPVGDLQCDCAKGLVHSSVLELRLDKPLPEESMRVKTILKRQLVLQLVEAES